MVELGKIDYIGIINDFQVKIIWSKELNLKKIENIIMKFSIFCNTLLLFIKIKINKEINNNKKSFFLFYFSVITIFNLLFYFINKKDIIIYIVFIW